MQQRLALLVQYCAIIAVPICFGACQAVAECRTEAAELCVYTFVKYFHVILDCLV